MRALRVVVSVVSVALVGACAAGCSLLGLSNFEIGTCESASECEPLNERDDLPPSSCERWTCGLAGRCVLGPRDLDGDGDPDPACADGATDCDDTDAQRAGTLLEECDGVDNDCDQVVDEEALSEPALVDLATVRGADRVAASSSAGADIALLTTGAGDLGDVVVVRDGTPAGARDLGHAQQASDCNSSLTPVCTSGSLIDSALAAGDHCPVSTGAYVGEGLCNEADVAIDRLDGAWITASVSTVGCERGRLIIGPLVDEVDTRILLRGPINRSNTLLGVDVGIGDQDACTGVSRAGTDAGVLGAARPAVSGMTGTAGFPQALVAWLGDDVARPTCGTQPDRPVELLVVALETGPPSSTSWVTGAGDGIPIAAGRSPAAAAPVIAPISAEIGWLVAYPGLGSVELVVASPMVGAFPPVATVRPDADTPRTMPSFSVSAPATMSFAGDELAIALGESVGGTTDVGLVYAEAACGGNLLFRRGTLSGGDASSIVFDEPIALGAGRQPTIAYAPSGLVTAEFSREGMTAGDRTGGWMIAWASDAGIRGQRVLALDGRTLDSAPFALSMAGDDGHPALYAAGARLAFVEGTTVRGATLCRATGP